MVPLSIPTSDAGRPGDGSAASVGGTMMSDSSARSGAAAIVARDRGAVGAADEQGRWRPGHGSTHGLDTDPLGHGGRRASPGGHSCLGRPGAALRPWPSATWPCSQRDGMLPWSRGYALTRQDRPGHVPANAGPRGRWPRGPAAVPGRAGSITRPVRPPEGPPGRNRRPVSRWHRRCSWCPSRAAAPAGRR